jgi:hypothetical protein
MPREGLSVPKVRRVGNRRCAGREAHTAQSCDLKSGGSTGFGGGNAASGVVGRVRVQGNRKDRHSFVSASFSAPFSGRPAVSHTKPSRGFRQNCWYQLLAQSCPQNLAKHRNNPPPPARLIPLLDHIQKVFVYDFLFPPKQRGFAREGFGHVRSANVSRVSGPVSTIREP